MIRPASPKDARAIAEVHVQSWQHAYRDLLPQAFLDALSVDRREAMWAESLAKAQTSVLVAEQGGAVVGFSAFGPCRDDGSQPGDWELGALYLAPGQWSTGLGRALWSHSREAMVAQGAARIGLWVLKGNERAIRFYAAAGFRPEPDSTRSIELAGERVQQVRYLL